MKHNNRLLFLLSASSAVLSGCSVSTVSAPTAVQPAALRGSLHGGQQPVSGASIQLYAAGTSGYGSGSRALLATPVKTGGDGSFNITGTYTCQSSDLVYIVATGGNPGVPGTQNNSALAMMTGLGSCGNLTSATFISINELTTVASVWSLAPFIGSSGAIGTSSSNIQGLANAFAGIATVVNTSSGTIPGPALPAGATLPVAELNTLADILSTCVNTVDSTSPAAQSSPCQALVTAASAGQTATSNTLSAAINLAQNPTRGLALSSSVTSNPPFQPTLNGIAPTDWTVAINYTGGGLSQPSAIAVDQQGNVFIANAGNNSVTKLSTTGAALSGASGFSSGSPNAPSAIAVDQTGNVWVANRGNSTLSELSNSGLSGNIYSGGGLSQPNSLSIDAMGDVWVTNFGNSSVSEFANNGNAISGSGGFTSSSINKPVSIAVNPK